jgi:hypothetical protein
MIFSQHQILPSAMARQLIIAEISQLVLDEERQLIVFQLIMVKKRYESDPPKM